MNAYWSIPVCDESKRLTAFHTPDGIYCWNRLLMGAKPSSAVQQSAYLEALDKYIDYVKEYAVMASPLHNLTKKATTFPKPCLEGSVYDIAFHRLKAILLDTSLLYLHHKK
jgi:hypothetical protein